MAWFTPKTWVAGDPLPASDLNTYVRDNINDLHRRTTASGVRVAAESSRTNAAFGELADFLGPEVPATVGSSGICFVVLSSRIFTPAAVQGIAAFKISGATTRASANADALYIKGGEFRASVINVATGLTPGSNVFRMEYRSDTGAQIFYSDRAIIAIPFGA